MKAKGQTKMNKHVIPVWASVVAVTALAAMGLAFCWHCSALLCPPENIMEHWHFKRQLLWNIVGIAALGMAAITGWSRWIKAAPFIFGGWASLWLVAMRQPLVNGSCSFVHIGPVLLNVWPLFPVALALLAAWISRRYGVNGRWLIISTCAVAISAIALWTISDPDRMARLGAVIDGGAHATASAGACARAFAQRQSCAVLAHSRWFTAGDIEMLRALPDALTHSMPAASAVVFGKWFIAVALTIFGILALSLGCLWRSVADKAKRAFTLFFGLGILAPALYGSCACIGLVPMLHTSIPLVSYGGTTVLAAWIGVGILVSSTREENGSVWSPADYIVHKRHDDARPS